MVNICRPLQCLLSVLYHALVALASSLENARGMAVKKLNNSNKQVRQILLDGTFVDLCSYQEEYYKNQVFYDVGQFVREVSAH